MNQQDIWVFSDTDSLNDDGEKVEKQIVDRDFISTERLREILQDHLKNCSANWCDACGFISHAFGVLGFK